MLWPPRGMSNQDARSYCTGATEGLPPFYGTLRMALIGYARVSIDEQNTAAQHDALRGGLCADP
jgi:hypothetical protein